ncbi:DUF305 domain-containing protein [Brevundimonas sp. FT23042]|uniref:DUF305 domain-containing protein n=1 Tax=Brevundimonas sp. FT23042 TaxID=3393749 RepID=UPI003B58AE19
MTTQDQTAMGWGRFAAMIAVSTVIMFGLTYQLVYSAGHATFSLTRLVSALVMGCVMTAVMLGFMWKMYRPTAAKALVLVIATGLGGALLMLNRSQALVGDMEFMGAMIPHHSIAINNARKADLRDPRVRYLADRITRDQVKEIEEMKRLMADIRANGRQADTRLAAGPARLTPAGEREAEALVSGRLPAREPL